MGLVLTLSKTFRLYENITPILKAYSIIVCVRECGQTRHSPLSGGLSIAQPEEIYCNTVVKNGF